MNREFLIFASAQINRFVVRGIGDNQPHAFPTLHEATGYARKERHCRRGLVLVCSYCRRIGGDENYWSQIDAYLMEDSDLKISHGICEDCFERQAKELGLTLPPTASPILIQS